jgi:hypothetical protein
MRTADVVTGFLVSNKMDELGKPESKETILILRLFHLIFSALSKFHDIEIVIRTHAAELVEKCLRGESENIPCMFPSMFSSRFFHVPFMLPSCFLHVPFMFPEGSTFPSDYLHVAFMFPEDSTFPS